MSKRPTDRDEPAAKKRGSDRQRTKEHPSSEEEEEIAGTFQTANEETLKSRRILKARRKHDQQPASRPTTNPFAGINLQSAASPGSQAVPAPTAIAENQQAAPQEAVPNLDDSEQAAGSLAVASPVQQVTSEAPETDAAASALSAPAAGPAGALTFGTAGGGNAFNQQAGAPAIKFGAGAVPAGGEAASGGFKGLAGAPVGFGSLAGASNGAGFSFPAASSSLPLFAASPAAANGNGLAPHAASSAAPAAAVLPQSVQQTTGEESEETVWRGEGTLYENIDAAWKERGRGEMHVNRPRSAAAGANSDTAPAPARLIMRRKQQFRLLLNTNIWPLMSLNPMGDKSVTFTCVNVVKSNDEPAAAMAAREPREGGPEASVVAFRAKDVSSLQEFIGAVKDCQAARPHAESAT